MIGLEANKIKLCPYCSEYKIIAKEIIRKLEHIFGDLAVKIEHVGSTAIAGIKSKPIIDITVGVKSFSNINILQEPLEENGFLFARKKLNNSIITYRCETEGKTTHNIHIVIFKGERWDEFVLFRDYLNSNPNTAKQYEELKINLAKKYKYSIQDYTKGKGQFVSNIINKTKTALQNIK